MSLVLAGIIGYVLLQLALGVWVSRRVASEEDYLLAGRNLGFGLALFSLFATWFGAETCIGAAGAVYEEGLSGGSADPFGYGLCVMFMGLVFAVPLWRRGLTTLADLFRQRYSMGVERLAVLMMAPTSVLWAAAQIRAFGQVLDATAGIGVGVGIAIAAAVAIVYTGFGGLRADVLTDLLQGIVLIAGLAVLAVIVLGPGGEGQAALAELPREKFRLFEGGNWLGTIEAWAVPICGSVVAQELVMRVLAARTPHIARWSALGGGALYLVVGIIPVGLGLAGSVMLPDLEHPEQVLPALAKAHLSAWMFVLFAGALVSAILSTVDSTLLAASSLVSHNLVVPLLKNPSEKTKVRVARWGVIGAGLCAYVLALQAESIFELVESASAFGSSGVFVIVVFGLFSARGGAASAYAALAAGMGVWAWGSMRGWEFSYVLSLAAAGFAYLTVAWNRDCHREGPPSNEAP